MRAAALVVAALLLAGCTTPAEDPATTPSTPATSEPPLASPAPVEELRVPRAGACYRLTLEDAASPTHTGPAVPCEKRHTARTIHVGELDLLVDGRALAVDSDRAQRQLRTTCPQRLAEFLGGDEERRRLSRLQVVWFSPTLEEADRGASWFRCDVIALGRSSELLPLPRDQRLRGVLDRPDALRTFGLCGTARPGTPGFERVACALRHSWVAVSTLSIDGGDRYPGAAAVRAAGDDVCADRVRAANDFVLEYEYGWEWPTRQQWRAGQRHGYCWAPAGLA